MDKSLSHGSIELCLRCLNLTVIGWGEFQPFSMHPSLLRVDLSGCPKLESIPEFSFADCHHLVSVIFGEHSSITNLGRGAFNECSALTSITLPNKLKVVDEGACHKCTSLKRVVCNKKFKTIGDCAFQECAKLEDVQLTSSSSSFGRPFIACDRLIELAAAAGFPSNTFSTTDAHGTSNRGVGVPLFLIDRFERSERK